jgi:hypothetical protein
MAVVGPLMVLLFIGGPCAIALWIGMRAPWPLLAFFLAWVMTPLISLAMVVLLMPLIRATIPPGNDGTGVIMIPIYGILTGLIAGIAAAIMVSRRSKVAMTTTETIDTPGAKA